MIRDPVSSSNIASIGYDSDSETLEIEFTNGSIYQYFNLPDYMSNSWLLRLKGNSLTSTLGTPIRIPASDSSWQSRC